MKGLRESEHIFVNKNLLDGSVKIIPGEDDTSESSNPKRKLESLFCVMRKRTCRHKSADDDDDDDDMFLELGNNAQIGVGGDEDIRNCLRLESDFWFENLGDNPYDPLDEGSIVDDCFSGSDTDLSESSDFDVISEHVLDDSDLFSGWKFLSVWSDEDEGTLISKWSSETLNSILLLSPDESGARFSHSNDIPLFHSEWKEEQILCVPGDCDDILECSVIKEDPPCNSDIFENNGDNSAAISCGVQGSMEIMCIDDDELMPYEPVPLCIVPPNGWESNLLETCSLHHIDSEYNGHDTNNIGLEISPIPLTKTLERPCRPWSVCGSIAAVRNLPLMEGSLGACRSLGEQLDVNVNSSEDKDKDAELAQTPSTLYQEEVDGADEIDIDAMIHKLNLVPDNSDSCFNREEWNMSKHPRHALIGLEQCTRASLRRAIMFHGAIAVLHSRDSKHYVRKGEVIIGRSSDGLNVDIDLGKYNYRSKISRLQALVKLENYGSFSLKNLGKQHILVNGERLDPGQIVTLTSCSSIDIRGITFMFKVNEEAVRQFLKNNKRRKSEDDTKFRWCG